MNSMQQRIMGRIESILTQYGYSVSESRSYSNCGSLFVFNSAEETLPIGEIHFDFQTGNYTLSLTVSGVRVPSQEGRPDYFSFYQDYNEATRFWEMLEKHLPAREGAANAQQ